MISLSGNSEGTQLFIWLVAGESHIGRADGLRRKWHLRLQEQG